MDQILVYSDSLTWGIIPNTRKRLPFDERWPGVLENKLNVSGQQVRVIARLLERPAHRVGRPVQTRSKRVLWAGPTHGNPFPFVARYTDVGHQRFPVLSSF
jgi:hypothetical protein